MPRRRSFAVVSAATLVASLGTSWVGATTSLAAQPQKATIVGNHTRAADRSPRQSHVAAGAPQMFQVVLNPRDAGGARALAAAVSDPASPQFHHYLTATQWEARFSPTPAQVSDVSAFLRSQGLTVGASTPDRLSIDATGTSAQVEKAFGVTLNTYLVAGKSVQLAANDATVPAQLAGTVGGVLGLDQTADTPNTTTGSDQATPAAPAASRPGASAPGAAAPAASTPIPPPAGFRNPPDCSAYYGQKHATGVPPYGGGYPNPLPLAPCGYLPQQYQSAYGLTTNYASGVTGKGQTVAIVDAYASPTLLSDTQTYYQRHDPSQQLAASQFSELLSKKFTNTAACGASGWFGEQTLDVQAVHATAPGANILYAGAKSCFDNNLLSAVRTVVDNGLAQVVSNSYGSNAGDLLSSSSSRSAEDTVLQMAATTGITVQFSSGDSGDNFAGTGLTSPDYPASSPWATAVGGTSLAVASNGSMGFQTGWSTSKSVLCTADTVALHACTQAQLGTYRPPAPGAYNYGAGGGTSYQYSEPYYQTGTVPAALANRNRGVTGTANRVVPDISMDADPNTGMLVGETQTFPNGVYYDEYRIGGTSLASPLLAGVVALADQAAGTPLGFLNPVLYKADPSGSSAGFTDVVPRGKLADFRTDYANTVDATNGYIKSVRTLDYQGPETYCDGSGNCATRNVVISTARGYDDMTGLGTPAPGFVNVISKY